MKMTRHNGRSGKNGTYNPKHNDRRFNLENSEHIDAERARKNIYWDIFNGYRSFADMDKETELADTFEDVEQLYYSHFYRDFVEGQNGRNEKNRHSERNRSADDIRKNKKTCPEESLFQLGTMDDHASPEVLLQVALEFMDAFEKRFGSHIHILDWALHLDESTPHIHERHVFDCENKYGELCPQQEKALEALGFDLPEPDKKAGRYNNRKMVFDSACRAMMFDIAKSHGLNLDEEPEYGGCKYLEKQDYILMKQKEKISKRDLTIEQQGEKISDQVKTLLVQNAEIKENAGQIREQTEKLEELSLKVEDVETLIQDVSEAAYDKAVEVVTEKVRVQTQQEDIAAVADYQKKLNLPDAKVNSKVLPTVNRVLDNVQSILKNAAKQMQKKISTALKAPENRNNGVEQVKEKARESIYDALKRGKIKADQQNEERRARQSGRQTRKKNMEI
ncbi:MAG: serine/arginine repetitive matrix protein 2 [Clostridiales bacterium]|nr:serine/arginine repetitive matrix protein 2 [Clostridiales bacterium]